MESPIDCPKVGANIFRAETEWRDIETITPYVRNTMKHSRESVDALAGAIAEWGFDVPIVVDAQGVIIKGHRRLRAARQLGMSQVPVIVRTDLTPEQVKAARIADNKLPDDNWDLDLLAVEMRDLKTADFDLDLLGFSDDELAGLDLDAEPPPETKGDPDAVPENVETRCKPGDLWQLGAHRLLCGDSTNVQHVERLMGGEKADLWLTDPPYGVSYADKNEFLNSLGNGIRLTKRIENDHMSLEEMERFWFEAATSAYIACSDEAPYYWFACQGGDQMMMMMMSISRANWKVRHELIWVKNNHVLGRCDYNYKHEPILYGWKKDGTHKFYGDFQTSVLEFNKPQSSKLHPTMKPIELIERLVQNSAAPQARVLDTFLGSGSTLVACEKTGRRCFGMEIDPHYCDVILKRWEDFTGKQATLLEAGKPPQNDLPSAPPAV